MELDEEAALGEEAAEGLRSKLVCDGAHYDLHYEIGQIPLKDQTDCCAIIAVGIIDDKVLVCVPVEAWTRKVSSRLLPSKALQRPICCSITACGLEDRELFEEPISIRVWFGMLSSDLEDLVVFDRDDEPQVDFKSSQTSDRVVPFAEALGEVAVERFTYHSAESGGNQEPPPAAAQEVSRLDKMEETIKSIQESLSALVAHQLPRGPSGAAQPDLAAKPGPSILKPTPNIGPPPGLGGGVKFRGLDKTVVQSALASGIPEKHLEEMSQLLAKHPRRMEDMPRTKTTLKVDDLDESAEEEEAQAAADVDTALDGGSNPMETAILQLTKVCTALAAPQTKKGTAQVEALLDGTGLDRTAEGSGSGSSRRNSVALRALQRCLTEHPEYVYQTIEKALAADFQGRAPRPGEPLGGGTVRGWLESRSRITNFQPHVRWAWAAGAIWDCLCRGDIAQARARAALLVAAADQTSIDGGSWVMSGVALLEPPPPFQSFQQHSAPGPQELQHSALLDQRWVELFLSHIKEMDTFQETKRKFARGGSSRGEKDKEDPPKPTPKVKVKAKGKGSGKGSDADNQPAPSAA